MSGGGQDSDGAEGGWSGGMSGICRCLSSIFWVRGAKCLGRVLLVGMGLRGAGVGWLYEVEVCG